MHVKTLQRTVSLLLLIALLCAFACAFEAPVSRRVMLSRVAGAAVPLGVLAQTASAATSNTAAGTGPNGESSKPMSAPASNSVLNTGGVAKQVPIGMGEGEVVKGSPGQQDGKTVEVTGAAAIKGSIGAAGAATDAPKASFKVPASAMERLLAK